ncbi:MAG: TRL-like family protein [Candidatus Margulisbacteria bacterium]|nr:TRL-like family protein [Candidatus Margulisiibacteriota bacterium]
MPKEVIEMKRLLSTLMFLVLATSYAFATVPGSYYIGASEPRAASEIAKTTKKAEGSCISILSLIAFGDASVDSLTKSANIKEIRYIDKSTFSIFGLFVQDTYKIYGN